jgi:peptidoglycan/LPS O-acetylase OafA/YrhL
MVEGRQPRLHMLDGLRGVCAIAVMFYHFNLWNGFQYFQVGYFGVYLFFCLSGFSLWYVYARQPMTGASFKSFFIARFARIFPLYTLIVLLYLLMVYPGWSPSRLNAFILNASFLFGLAEPGRTSSVTGGWSIGIEWVFYLAFPLMWVFLARLRGIIVILLASLLINQLYVYSLLKNGGTIADHWTKYVHAPVFLVYFVAGIASAEIYRNIRLRAPALSNAFQWLARFAALGCLAFIFLYPADSPEDYILGYHFPLLIVASMAMLLASSLIDNFSSAEIRLYKFLGDISFGAYLMHYLVYQSAFPVLVGLFPEIANGSAFMLLAMSTLLAAYVLYRYFERPARDWINRRGALRYPDNNPVPTLTPVPGSGSTPPVSA